MIEFEVFINFYQGFLLIYFMAAHFQQKKHSLWIDIGAVALIGVCLTELQYGPVSFPEDLLFVVPFFYALWTTREKGYVCLLWTLIEMICLLGTLTLYGTLYASLNGTEWLTWKNDPMINLIYLVGANIVLTLVMITVARIGKKQPFVSVKAIVIITLILVCCLTSNECMYLQQIRQDNGIYTAMAVLCMLVVVFLTIVLYELMNADAEKRHRLELSLQTNQLIDQHQGELRSIYGSMLSVQHDLRHRIALAEELLAQADLSDENKERVLSLLDSPELFDPYITGNLAMDALLRAKVATMSRCGIAFEYIPYPLKNLPIPEREFCVMMSNMLDNAIEGVMRLPASAPERKIFLKIEKPWDMMSVTCTNSADPETVHPEDRHLITSKKHTGLHGFGTESIRKTAERYGGDVRFSVKGQTFSVNVLLPMEKN